MMENKNTSHDISSAWEQQRAGENYEEETGKNNQLYCVAELLKKTMEETNPSWLSF